MNKSIGRTRRPQFYYGWIIVGVALVSMAFWLGIRSSFSVFYVALLEEFHWTRAGSAGVQSMALLIYTLLAPLVGALIDRFGPRRVVVPGILVLALGLVLCSQIETLNQFYLFYGVVLGTGITCIGIITYSAILAHWFEKKRGLASGIAVSGMGLGGYGPHVHVHICRPFQGKDFWPHLRFCGGWHRNGRCHRSLGGRVYFRSDPKL